MNWLDWYNTLAKPDWTPSPATIGVIWRILYPVIAVTFGYAFVQAVRQKIPWRVALPFAINLAANLAFTPIQFGLRNLPLATVDILIVLLTIPWMMAAVWRHYRWVTLAQVPYLLWVATATVLQISITAMNWGLSLVKRLGAGSGLPCRRLRRSVRREVAPSDPRHREWPGRPRLLR
jgi:benzodiazapine receptor